MDDLLNNNAIKDLTQKVLNSKSESQKETENIIAFLEKNHDDIKLMISMDRVGNSVNDIVRFVNTTCKTNIVLNYDINKYIVKKFNLNNISLDFNLQIAYVLSYVILLTFWCILLYMVNVLAFWWDDMSIGKICILSLVISTIHMIGILIFSKK